MDLSRWLNQTITYATPSSVSGYGDVTFATAATAKARVEFRTDLVRDLEGEIVESNHVVWSETSIPPNSRVWLPDDDSTDNNEARRVIASGAVTNRQANQTLYEIRL